MRGASAAPVVSPAEPPPGLAAAVDRGRRRLRRWRGRQRPLTPERLRRRRNWVVVAILATAVTGAGLADLGLAVVRNSTAGHYVNPSASPDEPGYQAYVASTPTLLVVHKGPDGELAGAALLALRPQDDGGSVVLIPPSTGSPARRAAERAGGFSVAVAYAGGGVDAVKATVAIILDVAVDDVIELDDGRWASLVGPVAPVTVTLDAPVGRWSPGEVSLSARDVGPFLAARSPDEGELEWLDRQTRFWTAWLDRVRHGGPDAVPGEIDVGIGRFVRGVASGPSASVLPVRSADPGAGSGPLFTPDDDRIPELIADAVPYPLSPAPGRRARVRLLNGTTDPGLTPAAARQLVEAGAEITIAGNAGSFHIARTIFAYESGDQRDEAEELARAFGVGVVEAAGGSSARPEATAAEADEEIDVTIVLGADARDLIGRLENAG